MFKRIISLFVLGTTLFGEIKPEIQTIYQNRSGAVYNIPNLVKTVDSTLLAIIEKRESGAMLDKKVFVKRSVDGGQSWSKEYLLAEKIGYCLANNSHMVDRQTGRITILMNCFRNGHFAHNCAPGYDGDNIGRHFETFSDDDGKTWSEMKEITRSVKPEKSHHTIINAGGKGVEISQGKFKGRFLVPVWVDNFDRQESFAIYSDDRGKSWFRGEVAKKAKSAAGNSTESQLVELTNGDIIMITRTTKGQRLRRQAFSKDGGVTWSEMVYSTIYDPSCQASVETYKLDGKQVIMLCHPHSQNGRKDGSVSLSYDDGKTWTTPKVVIPGSFGYSGIEVMGDEVVIYYEAAGRTKFNIARFPLKDLF